MVLRSGNPTPPFCEISTVPERLIGLPAVEPVAAITNKEQGDRSSHS